MTWTSDMSDLFDEQVIEWGDTLTYQEYVIDCIKTPINSAFRMMPNNYEKVADTNVDIRRADLVTSGLNAIVALNPANKRPVVLIESKSYEVLSLEDDDSANPIVKLKCRLLQ